MHGSRLLVRLEGDSQAEQRSLLKPSRCISCDEVVLVYLWVEHRHEDILKQ